MALNDNDKLLEALFPEEWYKQVLQAVDFAVHKLRYEGKAAVELSKYIIDWNIERRLDHALTECADSLLPRSVDWSKISTEAAFDAFNALLETCEICKVIKQYKLRINFGDNNALYNEFLLWKELSSVKFPTLSLKLQYGKTKGVRTLVVSRVKQKKRPAKG